ncbi:pentapeptide repeat-containing protein, partial [Mycobacterium tuberculosis]
RSSGGYLLDEPPDMTPSFPRTGVSGHAGAVQNDLRGLNLTGCRLRETSLVDTDLRKCVLRGADLSGARTTGARLDDADLRGATVDPVLWRTASLVGARVDVDQAVAFAAAHGLCLAGG